MNRHGPTHPRRRQVILSLAGLDPTPADYTGLGGALAIPRWPCFQDPEPAFVQAVRHELPNRRLGSLVRAHDRSDGTRTNALRGGPSASPQRAEREYRRLRLDTQEPLALRVSTPKAASFGSEDDPICRRDGIALKATNVKKPRRRPGQCYPLAAVPSGPSWPRVFEQCALREGLPASSPRRSPVRRLPALPVR